MNFKHIAHVAAAAGFALALVLLFLGGPPDADLPGFSRVRAAWRPSDVRLLDRHGEIIDELRSDLSARRLQWTPLAGIAPAMRSAVIAGEDRRFFSHRGLDYCAVVAAALARAAGRSRRGASTLSMQLVELLQPKRRRPKTIAEKLRQMRLASQLERRWSKSEILEAYLNMVSFRGELQGITAAAAMLFDKAPSGITPPEAAVLAALLRAPNASREAVGVRALGVNRAAGQAASTADVLAAVARAFRRPATAARLTLATHAAERLLRSSHVSDPIYCTLDRRLQRYASEALRRQLVAVRAQHVQDGAVLVADNRSGEVLAYVGGSGELSSAEYVDGVMAARQSGSALKPFLYALAIEKRLLTTASLLEDTPVEVSTVGGLYRPKDYDQQFQGLVSVRSALASSLNVPAVRTIELVGFEEFAQKLRELGFDGLDQPGDYYGPSLALGSADVSLWQLVNAYRTLANGGVWSPLRMTPAKSSRALGPRVYQEQTAFLISDVLADRQSRSATFGLENVLSTRFWSAAKTGTSKDMRDNWCIGYSRDFTVGVWVGNFSGEPMRDVSGVTGAAPVWQDVINWLEASRGVNAAPKPPAGLVARTISFPSGLEPPRREWFIIGTEPRAQGPRLAADNAAIAAPASGTIIALDPDIPPARQRVVLEATRADGSLKWMLDRAYLGSAGKLLLWTPRPGHHSLTLVDRSGRGIDAVEFEVRGSPLVQQ